MNRSLIIGGMTMITLSFANAKPDSVPGPYERTGSAYNVPLYTGTIYPVPRRAEYADRFISIARVGIVPGDNVSGDKGMISVLKERLRRYGAEYDIANSCEGDFDAFVCVGDGTHASEICPDMPSDKPEAFLIAHGLKKGKPVIVLKGNDRFGLLWAVTSFNQLVTKRDGKPVALPAAVSDYPDVVGKRAYNAMNDGSLNATWFGVHCLRPNIVMYRMAHKIFKDWRIEHGADQEAGKNWRAKLDGIAAMLNPLGIEWYQNIMPMLREEDVKARVCSSDEQRYAAILDLAMSCAERGGNLAVHYDDFRFPVHPKDVEKHGTARDADVAFLNRLYKEVHDRYPGFKLLFCPPFYWGPKSDPSETYGESRDRYLEAIAGLPDGIDFYWCGSRVRTEEVDPDHAKWFAGLVGRKPVYWQNAYGLLHGGMICHYDTDSVPAWKDWYGDRFFDDIAFYTINTHEFALNMTLFDYMWNSKAYDPAASIVEADMKLVGTNAYPKLVSVYDHLYALDSYEWKPSASAARDIEKVKKETAELTSAYAMLSEELDENGRWLNAPRLVRMRKACLKKLLAMPNLKELGEADDKVRELAVRETRSNPETAIVLTPGSFRVKRPPRTYHWKTAGPRFVAWINGANTDGYGVMKAGFSMDGQTPSTGYELVMCGLDHNKKPPCSIRISLNGNTIFEGENAFDTYHFEPRFFDVPAKFFSPLQNEFLVENLEDADNVWGPPWFMFNYAVLRPVEKKANKRSD